MTDRDLEAPDLYINRHLSWLEFNDRVLRVGLDPRAPLLERVKFLSIVSSNLDEFFQVRLAILRRQAAQGKKKKDPSGLTAKEQLDRIGERIRRMTAEQVEGIRAVLGELAGKGLQLVEHRDLGGEERRFLEDWIQVEALPALTPLSVAGLDPFPNLPGLDVNVLVRLEAPGGGEELAVIPIPGKLPRLVELSSGPPARLVRIEDAVLAYASLLFPGRRILSGAVFRLLRDADVEVEDEAGDLPQSIEEAARSRRRRNTVRLEVAGDPGASGRAWLLKYTRLAESDVTELPFLPHAGTLMDLFARPGFDALRDPPWPPQPPRDLAGREDLWAAFRERDVLLFVPYESFEPVLKLLELAADDPSVLAIKQTLYRTHATSAIVASLERAAESGKQVTVLVELRARFDEERNVRWARRLEDAGCHVIYGVAGYKTHAKALLIVRREPRGIRRTVHLSTGNYNERTARLYSDFGLFTCHPDFGADVSAFFNLLTGASQTVGWKRIAVGPMNLRSRFMDLIEREARLSTRDEPGLIQAKMNSLQDKGMTQALYRAAQAGVRVRLNVRGICIARPGVPGLSENMEVVSIVDRYLEHARIYHFRNGGDDQIYLASADFMERNLDKRVELLFPVLAPELKARLLHILETCLSDNVSARRLEPDGSYAPVSRPGPRVRAQEIFQREAEEAAREARPPAADLKPLLAPEKKREE